MRETSNCKKKNRENAKKELKSIFRMWRKNRRPSAKILLRSARQFWPNQPFPGLGGFGGSAGGSNGLAGFSGSNSGSKCWGTDPNRNFDINHGTAGSSDNPCQDTYHGDRPFSEGNNFINKCNFCNLQM